MLKRIAVLVFVVCALPVLGVNLVDAKSRGLVGEKPDGFLGAVVKSREASALVKQVNGKRESLFKRLAKKNRTTIDQIAERAGKRAIKKTKVGHYVMNAAGRWVKKSE